METIMIGIRPTGPLHLGHYYSIIKPLTEIKAQQQIIVFIADLHNAFQIYNSIDQVQSPLQIRNISNKYTFEILTTMSQWINFNSKNIHIVKQSSNRDYHITLMNQLEQFCSGNDLFRNPIYINQMKNIFYNILQQYYYNNHVSKEAVDKALEYMTEDIACLVNGISGIASQTLTDKLLNIGFKDNHIKKIIKSVNGIYGSISFSKYPILMAADILLCHPDTIIVGKDQQANINLINDIFEKISNRYNINPYKPRFITNNTFFGNDNEKMSSSKNNHLNLSDITSEEKIIKYFQKYKTYPRTSKTSPGIPDECPLFMNYFSIEPKSSLKNEIKDGCLSGHIGCVECKNFISHDVYTHCKPTRRKNETNIAELIIRGEHWASKRYKNSPIVL